ncbi:MAG: hypothetical protein ACRDTE_06765 [Pseudonocardiaceae bacterium]
MKAIKLSLATAALAAGTLLLSGCEPSNTSGGSGTSGGAGVTCDSNGWGPLSGCDEADSSGPTSSSHEPAGADNRTEFEQEVQTEDQKSTETTEYRVTITWIVVSIDVTGFRECVIDLREASQDADDRFSRRITTPEDCEAQQIDAVYRPVSE